MAAIEVPDQLLRVETSGYLKDSGEWQPVIRLMLGEHIVLEHPFSYSDPDPEPGFTRAIALRLGQLLGSEH